MQQQEILRQKLAELGALRIVQERDMVVGFLRTRTNRFVPQDIDNQSIAEILVDMMFNPQEQEKSIKVILGEEQYLNVAAIVVVGLVFDSRRFYCKRCKRSSRQPRGTRKCDFRSYPRTNRPRQADA